MSNLDDLIKRNATVEELARATPVAMADADKERHRIYANLLRAITVWSWNGNKYGVRACYPRNPQPTDEVLDWSPSLADSYLGHNIAAIAVDGRGQVIDFQFNHNEIFNSSIEHAEARLLRRVFSLAQIADSWTLDGDINAGKDYGTLLGEVTVYTTLESCSQCSGIMTLAGVKEVVYLQPDPGMYRIGYMLRQLTERTDGKTYLQAPLPISPPDIELSGIDELLSDFASFVDEQRREDGEPFAVIPPHGPAKPSQNKYTTSITSFLCTEPAYRFFARGWVDMKTLEQAYAAQVEGCFPDWTPPLADALSNREALAEAMDFYRYARTKGNRGTPHRV